MELTFGFVSTWTLKQVMEPIETAKSLHGEEDQVL